jgi:ubiquinone/menaquinone biosynthesis C-methylase UbiE
MPHNNYDPIAGSYDFLSRLFFGRAEVNAQVELLRYIGPGSRILVVGGGTGWILEKLAAIHPSGLRITYIESSVNMMALTRKRNWRQNEVALVQLPVERFVTDEEYDCILTGFLFDNFSPESAAAAFHILNSLLKNGGYWLFADFHYRKGEGKLWQSLMLRTMYWSARLVCKVDARELPDTEPLFAAAGYRQAHVSFHYGRFIKSIAYEKDHAL